MPPEQPEKQRLRRNVRERIIDTPQGPVHAVSWERARPVEEIRDMEVVIQAYRQVAGVTARAEVLSPCGHEVPRFDQTQAFTQLTAKGAPLRYPSTRLCPVCQTYLPLAARKRVEAAPQVAAEWGSLTRQQRTLAVTTLKMFLEEQGKAANWPDPLAWDDLSPAERGELAHLGEVITSVFGLTFREYLHLKAEPAPTLTPAALKRLQASPQEKQRRAERRNTRAYLQDRAR